MGLGQSCWRDAGKTSFFAPAESNFSASARKMLLQSALYAAAAASGAKWHANEMHLASDIAKCQGWCIAHRRQGGKEAFQFARGAIKFAGALQVSARVRVHKSARRSHRVHYYEIFSDVTLAPSARVYADWFFRALGWKMSAEGSAQWLAPVYNVKYILSARKIYPDAYWSPEQNAQVRLRRASDTFPLSPRNMLSRGSSLFLLYSSELCIYSCQSATSVDAIFSFCALSMRINLVQRHFTVKPQIYLDKSNLVNTMRALE